MMNRSQFKTIMVSSCCAVFMTIAWTALFNGGKIFLDFNNFGEMALECFVIFLTLFAIYWDMFEQVRN